MATLGQKLREIRHQKDLKLNEVAQGADLSISFISLIERDKASISVENLQKLANFYNVRLFEIFQDIEEEEAFVVRKAEMEGKSDPGYSSKPFLLLLSPEDHLSFKAVSAQIPASSNNQAIQLHKGETFIFVQEGRIEISMPNKKEVVLNQGDSAHLTSYKGIYLKNLDSLQPAKLLIVASASTLFLNSNGNPLGFREVKTSD